MAPVHVHPRLEHVDMIWVCQIRPPFLPGDFYLAATHERLNRSLPSREASGKLPRLALNLPESLPHRG
jgi:hypothetical protein